MLSFKHQGDFKNTLRFLKEAPKTNYMEIFNRYGKEGVIALSAATPKDTGLTSKSWAYKITKSSKGYTLAWTNSNVINGVPIAIILQYGHATGRGGYVQGRDYINPAVQPIFERLTTELWKEVQSL